MPTEGEERAVGSKPESHDQLASIVHVVTIHAEVLHVEIVRGQRIASENIGVLFGVAFAGLGVHVYVAAPADG